MYCVCLSAQNKYTHLFIRSSKKYTVFGMIKSAKNTLLSSEPKILTLDLTNFKYNSLIKFKKIGINIYFNMFNLHNKYVCLERIKQIVWGSLESQSVFSQCLKQFIIYWNMSSTSIILYFWNIFGKYFTHHETYLNSRRNVYYNPLEPKHIKKIICYDRTTRKLIST